MKQLFMTFAIGLFALSTTLGAQAPVVGHPDPESLFTDPDPKLHASLFEEYIQHNPAVASGLAPVMKFFGNRPSSPIPDRKSWKTQVVAVVAEDDLVVVAFRREMDDPRKPGAKYTTTWFDMWRIKDGKAVEHWDYGLIAPPK